MKYDIVIIGGGPAGLAAAYAAWQDGCRSICIVERDRELGGILNQCIHNGFGLHFFHEELTGPEYAGRFIDLLASTGVTVMLDTMVLEITRAHEIHVVSSSGGYQILSARAVILAMGCRERTRGAIAIPGTRPAGVFTAGTAQRYVNIEGLCVGKRVVILGSGDIGLIMARRMTLEGAKVLACVEVMPYSGGLARNIAQCLHDFDIPLYLSHTITEICGKNRVEGVVISQVDSQRKPIAGTEMFLDCDTVLLSVGLIPENELSSNAGIQIDSHTKGPVVFENMETSLPGIFACGNVLHVHDLVDYVTDEAGRAGKAAAAYCAGHTEPGDVLEISPGNLLGYTIPQRIHRSGDYKSILFFFRVQAVCGKCQILVTDETGMVLKSFSRDRLAPGEMENIRLSRDVLEKAKGSLTIHVKEAEK